MRWAATSIRSTFATVAQMAAPNCNDQIAARAFGCKFHIPPLARSEFDQYDAVFATMWKVKTNDIESRWMDLLHDLCDKGKKVVLFQEAETPWALTRSWEEQKSFIELLGKVDLFLTHNTSDVEYWGRLRPLKATLRWRTCIDVDWIRTHMNPALFSPFNERPILFGSSYDDRANGLAGLIACKDLGRPLWHQNRSSGYEDRNREMPALIGVKIDKEIPHGGWFDWLNGIHGTYIAVHPMPAAAAGRDQIAFAALGIPCIGNEDLDIQGDLFPNLRVKPYDVRQISDLVKNLLMNETFYLNCRNHALGAVRGYGLKAADHQAEDMKMRMGWS